MEGYEVRVSEYNALLNKGYQIISAPNSQTIRDPDGFYWTEEVAQVWAYRPDHMIEKLDHRPQARNAKRLLELHRVIVEYAKK